MSTYLTEEMTDEERETFLNSWGIADKSTKTFTPADQLLKPCPCSAEFISPLIWNPPSPHLEIYLDLDPHPFFYILDPDPENFHMDPHPWSYPVLFSKYISDKCQKLSRMVWER